MHVIYRRKANFVRILKIRISTSCNLLLRNDKLFTSTKYDVDDLFSISHEAIQENEQYWSDKFKQFDTNLLHFDPL